MKVCTCVRAVALLGFIAAIAAGCGVSILPVGEAPRMPVDKLVTLLDDPSLTIVDVRHEILWKESHAKIPGALRGDAKSVSWAKKYPKDAFLVLYCA